MSSIARNYLNQLNADYLQVHRRKEDLFWSTYMGTSDDQAGFTAAEQAYKAFCADPARLPVLRQMQAQAEETELKRGLGGWIAFFECNVIEDPQAAALMDKLVAAEAALFARRRELKLTLLDEQGRQVAGSLPTASTALAASSDEAVRQSALAMFHTLEQWVVDNGYLAIVALRNRFARAMGYRDYFDYKVHKNEQMSPAQLFAILDDFIAGTEQRLHQSLAELKAAKGEAALLPHNLRYSVSGDVTRQLDPYVPFSRALQDWVESFRRLGIQYRGATLTLDLLTREGKYENGFCHGPVPSFWQEGSGCRRWSTSPVWPTRPRWAAAGAGSTPCSTRAAMRRTLPMSPATPPASPRSSRPPPWPTPRPSRCSATACWTMRTGSNATPETRRGSRSPMR